MIKIQKGCLISFVTSDELSAKQGQKPNYQSPPRTDSSCRHITQKRTTGPLNITLVYEICVTSQVEADV